MLTTQEITRMLAGCPSFLGVFACDRLPSRVEQRPATLIVNTDPASESGEHWVAIHLIPGNRAEFFCPFGFPPLLRDLQIFLHLNAASGLQYNQCTIQDVNSTLCGNYCICFVKCVTRGQTLSQFISRFRSQALGPNSNEHLLC